MSWGNLGPWDSLLGGGGGSGSISASPSLSGSPSESPSMSPSISPSISLSISVSGSPSFSPSGSPSISSSVSSSLSPSASLSASLSPSSSASVSPSLSPSISLSTSRSASASLSSSLSPSHSISRSISHSWSPSASHSPSHSISASESPSVSPSSSLSASASSSLSPSHSLSASPSPGSGGKGDFTNTNAFFWAEMDLSSFAGTDLGSTPYRIVVEDGNDKKASGYIGAVGAGETLGSEINSGMLTKDKLYKIIATEFGHFGYTLSGIELVANGGFGTNTLNWVENNCTFASIVGGQSGNCLEITRVDGASQRATQVFADMVSPPVDGKQYKFSAWVKSGTSGDEAFRMQDDYWGEFAIAGISSGTWTYYEYYFTHSHGAEFEVALLKDTATPGTMLFDSISIQEVTDSLEVGEYFTSLGTETCNANNKVKQVTDPPSTAIHIISSPNGTVRAWDTIESGFDPNTIDTFTIYAVSISASVSPSWSPSSSVSPSPSPG